MVSRYRRCSKAVYAPLLNHDFDYALILSGDQLYQMDFNAMLEAHIEAESDITIATLPVNDKDAPEFGILKTNSDSCIESFIETCKRIIARLDIRSKRRDEKPRKNII